MAAIFKRETKSYYTGMVGYVTAAVSLACSLALCALGLKLSLGLHSGWLFAFASFGLLWGTLRQLGLARGGKSV